MSEKTTVVVKAIEQKSGTSKKSGKAYTQHKLVDANGIIYSCFDGSIVAPVQGSTGQKVDIEWEQNGDFKNLLRAEPHEETSVPETYAARLPDGAPDWDKKGLHMTRCALWNHFLSGHLAANLYAKAVAENAKLENSVDAMDYVIRTGTRLVVHAEKDVFERPPGDDGIPFDPNDIEI